MDFNSVWRKSGSYVETRATVSLCSRARLYKRMEWDQRCVMAPASLEIDRKSVRI